MFAVEVECSSGTYVRSLAADLGAALGGGAHLRGLRRTAVGPFTDGPRPDRVEELELLPPARRAVAHLAAVAVDEEVAALVRHRPPPRPGRAHAPSTATARGRWSTPRRVGSWPSTGPTATWPGPTWSSPAAVTRRAHRGDAGTRSGRRRVASLRCR